jgi:hypothetical protein
VILTNWVLLGDVIEKFVHRGVPRTSYVRERLLGMNATSGMSALRRC